MQIDDRTSYPAYWAMMPAAVLTNPTLGDKAKLIYAEISRLLGPDGYCWAKDKYLAERVGCSPKTVSRAIHDLAAADLIRVEMSSNHNGTERHIYAGLSPAQGGMDTHDHTPQGGMDTSDQTPMDTSDQTPPPTQYKEINNKYIPTRVRARGRERPVITKEAADVFIAWAGEDPVLFSALKELAKVRAAKRNPYETAKQATLLVNKLKKLSGGDRAVMLRLLDDAIEHGWISVYPPKDGRPVAIGSVEEAPDVSLWQPDDGEGSR